MPDSVAIMRTAPALIIALVFAACSPGSGDATTTSVVFVEAIPRPTSTSSTSTTVAAEIPDLCAPSTFFPQIVPDSVVAGVPDTADVPIDEFSLIAGTYAASQFDAEGNPVIMMIRGALPPRQFSGETDTVMVLNEIPAVIGSIGDGFWAAAWALPPGERCDLYSLIFYPPVDEASVPAVVESIG